MGGISALGQYVLWLHRRTKAAGCIKETDTEATQLLDALYGGPVNNPATKAQIAGLELRSGRPRNELAKKVQRAAVNRLRSLELVMHAVDELGYNSVLVRGLLQHHYWELKRAPLGSDAHIIYTDLNSAIDRASDRTKAVAYLLIAGLGPQEIGAVLKTNGSRRIGKAVAELSRILQGRDKGGKR